jgi:cell division protein FtsB
MRNSVWRRKYQLPPGYIQESLFEEEEQKAPKKVSFLGVMFRLAGIVMVIAFFTAYLTQQIYLMSLSQEVDVLEKKLAGIHRKNESLRLSYYQAEDLAAVEKIASYRLGMVRPKNVIFLKRIELASR